MNKATQTRLENKYNMRIEGGTIRQFSGHYKLEFSIVSWESGRTARVLVKSKETISAAIERSLAKITN
jgi:non-canonical (house-cleaning) NTP pyrophosphatase